MTAAQQLAPLTQSQVRKAGKIIRRAVRGEAISATDLHHAIAVLQEFRAAHSGPLVSANMGLRSMVKTAKCSGSPEVSQRLKRLPTIVDKLVREPTLPLHAMQDIGGVRAVLNNINEVRRVQARLVKNHPEAEVVDYIAAPRSSGYRGVHVVVVYRDRKIEVQLRTQVMHQWAITVERLSGRMGDNLKQDGDHVVQQLMAVISEAMATEELGGTVGDDLLTRMSHLREQAAPFLHGGQR